MPTRIARSRLAQRSAFFRRSAPTRRRTLTLERLESRLALALAAAFGFDEGAGTTAADTSGVGNHGTLSGATWSPSGKYGGGLSFDGVNDWVSVADSSSLDLTTGMTLEAWVNPSTINGWETVILKETTGELSYALYADNNGNDSGGPRRPGAWIRQGGISYSTLGTVQLATNQWTHLAATYDGSGLRLYVNGSLASTLTRSGSIDVSFGALRIGGNNVWSEWFNGLIDEVRVYNHALTQAEIQSDMNTPVTSGPDTTPPTITSTNPLDGATAVSVTANATVTFSEALNAATVNGNTLELRDAGGATVAAAVSYDAASRTATIDPSGSLTPGAGYSALVRGGATDPRVKDVAGNALVANVTWSFTTAPLSLTIGDVTVSEGNVGTQSASFLVSLSAASSQTVSVTWSTSDGSAAAGSDYTAVPPTVLTFDPGQLSQTVVVPVLGDLLGEGNEAFLVNLSSPVNAVLADSQGVGTINDDDGMLIGSEGFGYSAFTHPQESVDLVPGTAGVTTIRSTGNNNSKLVTLPAGNTFNFYGTSYTSFYVSTNGLITFGSSNTSASNTNLTSAPTQRSIAPLWDDWVNVSGQAMLLSRYDDSNGDSAPDRLVLEWNNVQGYVTSPSPVTFQAILQLNTGAVPGEFTFNYPDLNAGNAVSNGGSATVGIKDTGTQGTRRLLVSFNSATSPYVGSGRAIRFTADTAAPAVSLTAPADGANVSETIAITASASDNVGVVGVQFLLDGAALGAEDLAAPYSFSWNTTSAANGTHSLAAIARDAIGNTTTSSAVSVVVANFDAQAPTVAITNPANNATVAGTLTVSANAADNVGVVGVQFLLDGNNLGAEDATAPYSVSWNTTSSSNGTHSLTARARDAAGNTTTSTVVTATVSNSGGVPLTINGAQTFQTIDGFGVNVNAHSWNGGELRPALDMLHDQMGATLWRVVYDMEDWEATNDNADPNISDWTYYNSIYSNASFQELWGTLDYLNQKGKSDGITLSFMGRVAPWMGGSVINTALEDEWVETIATLVTYARNTAQVQFSTLDPLNEPDWDGIEGPQVDQWQYTRLLNKLSVKLDSLGMQDIRLLGPNTASIDSGVNTYMPAMMEDPVVMNKVDHFALHNYAGYTAGAAAAISGSAYPEKNFWITEVTNPWDIMTHLAGNPSAIMVWDGFDSAYIHPTLHGASMNPPNDAGNGPAPLAYNSATGIYTPRQSFYQDQQIFKYVPPGSVRVSAAESNGNLTVYAFYHQSSSRVTIVGRNAGTSNILVSGSLSNLPTVANFEAYVTDSSRNFAQLANVSVNGGSFSFSAPSNSFFTLTTLANPDTTPPSVSVTAPAADTTVSGTVTLSADATDNVGIAGVQFLLNGAVIGVEDTSTPYSFAWDTTAEVNGNYQLSARARDLAGNLSTSTARSVNVNNSVDTQPPSAPTNLSALGTIGTASLSWTAATDNIAVAGYNVHRSTTASFTAGVANQVGQPAGTTYDDTGLAAGTYYYQVVARDAAGNLSPASNEASAVVTSDTTAPAVAITSPAGGSTLSGTVTIAATASDNVAVAGVQFLLDGNLLGGEDLTAPHSVAWNTTHAANGGHTLTALARDGSGNTTLSAAVSVTVNNATSGGLVLALGFNEGSGLTAGDVSGSNNTGLLSGPAWVTGGKFGGALSFDGLNDWVTVADAASLDLTTGLTLEAWVNLSTINGWETVVLKEAGSELAYALYADNNGNDSGGPRRPGAWVRQGGTSYSTLGTAQLASNQWTHLATTYDGAELRLYVNGSLANTLTRAGSIDVSSGALRIGGNNVWSEWFNGLIDEVRVYNRALAASEIVADMNTAIGGGSLQSAVGSASPPGAAESLAAQQLKPHVDEAIRRWELAGISSGQLLALQDLAIEITDLPGVELGRYLNGTVQLDRDAAGEGWFVDPTPWQDSEFAPGRNAPPSADDMDLLTVLAHEMGHALGLDHDDEGIMADRLPLGVRRMQLHEQADLALMDYLLHGWANHKTRQKVRGVKMSPSDATAQDLVSSRGPFNSQAMAQGLWTSFGERDRHAARKVEIIREVAVPGEAARIIEDATRQVYGKRLTGPGGTGNSNRR